MILVTGATGTVGREVVTRLAGTAELRVLARDPSRVVAGLGPAETVPGDFRDPASLAKALTGVTTALLITARPGSGHDEAFVRAARSAGVRRVVKLSAAAVLDPGADDAVTAWQRTTEALLRGSGLEWTFVRPRAFMSNTLSWAPAVRAEGVVRTLYGASANPCVDPRDIAECLVRVLIEDGHAGRSHVLTGPEPITAVQQTAQLSRLLNMPVRHAELTPEEARAQWSRRYPATIVEALLRSARRQSQGAKAAVTDTVRQLTGHQARHFSVWARDHLAPFTSAQAAPNPS